LEAVVFKPNIEKLKSKSDVTSLCNALQHKNINIRHSAAKALGELGDSEAVDSLINALENDVEEIVRSSSAESLGIIGESHALKHLIEALKDVRVVSNKAYQAIININDAKASEYLRYVTTDDDVHFRRTVAALLRNMKDEEWAVDTLLNLLNDDDKDVSGISKSVLKEIGNPIIKRLINFAETNTLECKKSAVEILDELKWKPKGNAAPWYWVTKRDWRKCVVLGSFAVDALIETVKKEDDVSIRNYAAETLGKIGDERAVQPLIHALKYSDDINYSIFTKALGKIGGSEVVELLISTLKPGSGTTVSTLDAAKALGEIGDPRAVEPLIEALSSSIGKPHIEIAKALANIGDSRAIEPLTYALRDEFDESVFLTLQKIGGTKVIEPFIYRALDNNQGGTRFKQGITSTLREIGTEKAIGYL